MEKVHAKESEVFRCPQCNVPTQHVLFYNSRYTDIVQVLVDNNARKTPVNHHHLLYRCSQCKQETYFLYLGVGYLGGINVMPGAVGPTVNADMVIHQYPISTPAVHSAVPVPVTRSSVEAAKCLSVGAFNACGVMLRRAIHDICADKKAIGSDLYAQLKWLKDNSSITPDIWEWAEELRILGRSGAHPEWADVTPEEADYGMRFLDEILKYLYINPHDRKTMKLKETKGKK